MLRTLVAAMTCLMGLCPAAATPATPSADRVCARFMDIDQLLEQVLSRYEGQQEPTANQARIAILALRNASTKANAQLGAASEDLASAIGEYAQAASDYAGALNTEGNAGSQNQAEAAFDAARASAMSACGSRAALKHQ